MNKIIKLENNNFCFTADSIFISVKEGFVLETDDQNLDCITDIATEGVVTFIEKDNFIYGYKATIEIIDLNLSAEDIVSIYQQKNQRQKKILAISKYRLATEKIASCLLFFVDHQNLNNIYISTAVIGKITFLNRQTVTRRLTTFALKGIIKRFHEPGRIENIKITEILDLKKLREIIEA